MTVFPPSSPPTSGTPSGRGRFCLQPRMAPSTSGTGWTRIDRVGAQHHEQSEGSPGTSKMIEPCYKLLRHCSTNWCVSVKKDQSPFYDQTGIWLKKQFRRKTNWWKCGTCFMRIKLIFAFKLQKLLEWIHSCWRWLLSFRNKLKQMTVGFDYTTYLYYSFYKVINVCTSDGWARTTKRELCFH